MIYFIYGKDSYRSRRKLDEIIDSYKKVHKSGLNLIYIDAKQEDFNNFWSNFQITSMFAEKKLIILRNIFSKQEFNESFLGKMADMDKLKDIIVVYESDSVDERTKLFKSLKKNVKCQEFDLLKIALLAKWVQAEFYNSGVNINTEALNRLIFFVGSDLWQMSNEIKKLSNYSNGKIIKKEDVELLVKPNIENDIFKTIESLASRDKKTALFLLHKHIDNGDNALYLLSMITYQFRNLLSIKEMQDLQKPYGTIAKSCGLHPFVVQKSYNLCAQFTMQQLKKIYADIFRIDSDIKTGKVDPETALDLLVSEI